MKYLVLVGDANGEGDLFTFENCDDAVREFWKYPNIVLYRKVSDQILDWSTKELERKKQLFEPSAGHFQKGY